MAARRKRGQENSGGRLLASLRLAGMAIIGLAGCAYEENGLPTVAFYRHVDAEAGFRIDFPGDWQRTTTLEKPPFRLVIMAMRGDQPKRCDVIAALAPDVAGLGSEGEAEFVRDRLGEAFWSDVFRTYPGRVVERIAPAFLGERPASRAWVTYPTRGEERARSVTVAMATLHAGIVHTVRCSTDADAIDAARPVFERIMGSYAFL